MDFKETPPDTMTGTRQLKGNPQELENPLENKDGTENMIQYDSILSSIALDLLEIPEKEVYEFCAQKLKKILPQSTIMISSYDPKADHFVLACINGITRRELCLLENLMGKNLLEAKADFNKLGSNVQESLFDHQLMENPGGLYLATGQVFPEKLCNCAESLFGINKVYGIGLSWDNHLYGSIAIFAMGDDIPLKKEIIENIVQLVSRTLHKKRCEP